MRNHPSGNTHPRNTRKDKERHPAGLNFGDCFAYALAEARRDTLLFKGNDFAQTDVASALPLGNPD